MNPQPSEQGLDPLTHDNLANILGFNEATHRSLGQLSLDLLQDFLVLKSCLSGVPIGMEGKRSLSDEVKHPAPDAARASRPMSLCLCNGHRGLPPGVRKLWV